MRNTIKTITVAFALSALAFGAAIAAETKEVTRTVTIYSLDDAPDFKAKVEAICKDTQIKLSDKAKSACANSTFPKLTKSLRFRNAGIGAEFNTLAMQR